MRKIIYLLSIISVFSCLKMTGQGTITITPSIEKHDASSYVIATQRNHIFAQVKNPSDNTNTQYSSWFNQMLSDYGAITPSFGNQRKLYRLGGNEIDGQITPLQSSWYNNPNTAPVNFQSIINTCKTQGLISTNNIEVFSPYPNSSIMGYKNGNDYHGTNDRIVYIEDGDYKGYQFDQMIGQISNKTGGSTNYGKNDDLKYYLQEATSMNADLSVTINFSSSTAQKAVDMITYIKTQYGNFNRLKYIEFGNEVSEPYIKGNRKHFGLNASNNCMEYPSKSKNRIEYAQNCFDFANQLRTYLNANGGSNVKLGVVGTTNSFWAWNDPNPANGNQNLATLLNTTNPTNTAQKLSDVIDFIIFHSYPSYPIINPAQEYSTLQNPQNGQNYSDDQISKLILAQNAWNLEKRIPQQKQIISQNTTRAIKIANTEYFSHVNGQIRPMHTITEALYTADNIISALRENLESSVNFAFYHWQDNQSEISDNLMFKLNSSNTIVNKKPVFRVQELIANSLGNKVVESSDNFSNSTQFDIDVSNLTYWTTSETNFKYKPISYVVTKNANGSLSILLINRSSQTINNMTIVPNIANSSATIKSYKGTSYVDTAPTPANPLAQTAQSLNLSNFSIDPLSINIINVGSISTCTWTPTISSNITPVCNQPVIFTANGCPTGSSYLWSPGQQTTSSISVTPTQNTSYSVTCNQGGCSKTSNSASVTNCGSTVSGKIDLTGKSFTLVNGTVNGIAGNEITKLVNEQNVTTADLRVTPIATCGTCPSVPWIATWGTYPSGGAKGVLDLGKEYDISQVFFHGGSGGGNATNPFTITKSNDAAGTSIETSPFASNGLTGYNLWLRTDNLGSTVKRARYLLVTQPDANTRCNEIILYGTEVVSNTCTLSNVTPGFGINGNASNFGVNSGTILNFTNTSCPAGSTPKYYNSTTSSEVFSGLSISANTTYHSKCILNATCVSLKSADILVSINSATPTCNGSNQPAIAGYDSWGFSGNSKIYKSQASAQWTSAKSACENMNGTVGKLISLSTQTKSDAVNAKINALNSDVITTNDITDDLFIGLSQSGNIWSWVNGDNYSGGYKNWAYGVEPTTTNSYGTIVQYTNPKNKWYYQGSGAWKYYVCEVQCVNGTRQSTSDNYLKEVVEKEEMSVFPNPTSEKLTTEFYLADASEVTFTVVDMQGKTLNTHIFKGEVGNHTFVMDVSKLQEATYILKGNINDKIQTKKFSIVR